MPGTVSIVCPHCSANLKLKDSSKLGARIGCPKCKKPFVATEAADDELDLDALTAQERRMESAPAEEEDELPPPVRRKSAAASGRGSESTAGASDGDTKVPVYAHFLCGWPLLLVAIGGAIGGALGGVAYALNMAIYKSNLNGIAKALLIMAIGMSAFGGWLMIGIAIHIARQ